jgi:deoxynogalonate / 12-deoxyaklanonic acid monooxygenase
MVGDGLEDPSAGVTFVNRFTVNAPPADFERIFAETSEFLARQDGFLGNTLLRHVEERHSYVNIAHWRDADCFRRALADPGFGPHAAALRAISTSEPNLYLPRRTFPAPRQDRS